MTFPELWGVNALSPSGYSQAPGGHKASAQGSQGKY